MVELEQTPITAGRFGPPPPEPAASAQRRSELLWLSFLLSGDRGVSIDATVHALDVDDEARSRRRAIVTALSYMAPQLDASMHRTRGRAKEVWAGLPTDSCFSETGDNAIGRLQIERALLAIDIFPRCALLLTLFERIPLDEAASLLNATRDLARLAALIGLVDLTRNMNGADFRPFTKPLQFLHL